MHIVYIFLGYKKRLLQLLQVLGLDSCRDLFETLNILLLQSNYIFLLLCFVMNMDQHKVNSDIHGKDTRQNSYLHQTISNLPLHKWATYGHEDFQ
jgi:hypothetical protein